MSREPVVLAFDLGGTDLKFALARIDGTLAAFDRLPSRTAESAEAPLAVIVEVADRVRAEPAFQVVGIGLGCPGVIDPGTRRLIGRTPHLPHWRDFTIAETLAARCGLDVAVDNDANLAALAEDRLGAARGAAVSMTVTLGTGIGCGIVIAGQVFRGAWGGAGEIGHLALGRSGRPCACGVPDCVEPEASGSGLEADARRLGLSPPGAAALFAAASRGDATAGAAVEAFADRLGATLAAAIAVINPEVLAIGGGVAKAGDALIEPLRRSVSRYALASHLEGLRIVPAALGERAGAVGAGLMAWERASEPRPAPRTG